LFVNRNLYTNHERQYVALQTDGRTEDMIMPTADHTPWRTVHRP